MVASPMDYGLQSGFITAFLLADVTASGTVHYVGHGAVGLIVAAERILDEMRTIAAHQRAG